MRARDAPARKPARGQRTLRRERGVRTRRCGTSPRHIAALAARDRAAGSRMMRYWQRYTDVSNAERPYFFVAPLQLQHLPVTSSHSDAPASRSAPAHAKRQASCSGETPRPSHELHRCFHFSPLEPTAVSSSRERFFGDATRACERRYDSETGSAGIEHRGRTLSSSSSRIRRHDPFKHPDALLNGRVTDRYLVAG